MSGIRSSCGTYLFSLEGSCYLHDIQCNVTAQLPEEIYKILDRYLDGYNLSLEEHRMVKEFQDCGLLQELHRKPDPDQAEERVAYLTFAPTYQCNFRCSYCFGEHGEKYRGNQRSFTKETLYQMLEYFFFRAFPDAQQYRIDFVSGGEPLLGFDLIKMAVAYIEKHIQPCIRFQIQPEGKRVSVWLCTNGSLLTSEIIEYLSLHNISIGISLDGNKETNDLYRTDVHGEGTYDRIFQGIQLIQNSTKVSRKFKNIWALCTASNENCDFVGILEHMRSLGFKNVQIRLIRTEKGYQVDKILQEYDRLARVLLEMFVKGDLEFFYMILNNNDQFGKVLKRILLNHLLIRRCNAGVNKITICPDGSIYPCDSFVGITKFQLGDMGDADWNRAFYKNTTVFQVDQCRECQLKFLCGGDCYYNSFLKTGNPFWPDEEFCQIQRHIIELSIVLCYKMQRSHMERYHTLYREIKRKDEYSEIFG